MDTGCLPIGNRKHASLPAFVVCQPSRTRWCIFPLPRPPQSSMLSPAGQRLCLQNELGQAGGTGCGWKEPRTARAEILECSPMSHHSTQVWHLEYTPCLLAIHPGPQCSLQNLEVIPSLPCQKAVHCSPSLTRQGAATVV